MKTIEENLDRIATALEGICRVLGISAEALEKVADPVQAVEGRAACIHDPRREAVSGGTIPSQEVDTATTSIRTKKAKASGSGKSKIVNIDTAPAPEKTVEKQKGVTFPPEGAASFIPEKETDPIPKLKENKSYPEITQDQIIMTARSYVESGKSINEKMVRKGRLKEVIHEMGVSTVVEIPKEKYAEFINAVKLLGE